MCVPANSLPAAQRAGTGHARADTTVVLDREILGKPADAIEARAMLIRRAGNFIGGKDDFFAPH